MLPLIFGTDSYKHSHYLQYPPNTTAMHSYIEARGPKDASVVFFGLQAALKKYLTERVTTFDVLAAADLCQAHGVPFNSDGWMHIVTKHDGYMPVKIKAAPEGLLIPTGNALVTIESTDPEVFWAASFLETMLLRAVWYPSTVATISRNIKELIYANLVKTSDDPDGQIPFKLHDFGCRGVSSTESAGLGGLAHLVNFQGTDTIPALIAAQDFYGCYMAGYSIPAMEHSTVTSWGKENEVGAYRNMLQQYATPTGLIAVVSDSFSIYHACEYLWGQELKQEVIDSGATVVIRLDSGDPKYVVSAALDILSDKFGITYNSKGFKVLNHVRIMQGDGVTYDLIKEILDMMERRGYSADNIAFGMGGALLQNCNRDTYSFAMKCSAVQVDGEWRDVYKEPITQPDKHSKRGRQMLYSDGESFVTDCIDRHKLGEGHEMLGTVFENGSLFNTTTLDEVRKNAWPTK